MDMTENRTASFILTYFQELFKKREDLGMEDSYHEKEFVDQLMELSQPTSAFAYFRLTEEIVKDHEIFLFTLSDHDSLKKLIRRQEPVGVVQNHRKIRFFGFLTKIRIFAQIGQNFAF